MEFQLNEDFIKDNNLTEEQVKAVSGYVTGDYLPTVKKEWDGKANENAEGIIGGAVKSIQKQFGIELEREQGEKVADYLARFSTQVVSSKQDEIEKIKADYQEKIKGVKGTEALKEEYDKMKEQLDEVKQKYADYDELKEKAVKADEYGQQLSGLKLEVAFNGVKPNFPDTVNPYEAKAKWEEFKKGVLDKYNIELVDGIPMAIDKENEYKTVKLSELLSKDETIQELLVGRQQGGTGAKPTGLKDVDGVPFKVPENADAKTRSKLIAEHLATLGIGKMHDDYSAKFKELNEKIMLGQTQAA